MEMTMKMGAFKELSSREMIAVDGGLIPPLVIKGLLALGTLVMTMVSTKGCSDADNGK